jgi:anti-sigma B factor antagonist
MNSELVKIVNEEDIVVVTLMQEKILDDETITMIESEIMPEIDHAQNIGLVMDFKNVRFLTSAFLGFLIRLSKNIYESNGQLRLCGIDDKIMGIFKITRLDKIFDIHADTEKAILSLG